MSAAIHSLIETGTKLWLDSIDPELVATNLTLGVSGATSNPVIIAELLKTGRFDQLITARLREGLSDDRIAWVMTDYLVREAQDAFAPVWRSTEGNDGYVSFELDPLIEDPEANLPHAERVSRYVELGKHWAEGHVNRMIKVPATPAGFDALEELAAAGVTLNVTLIFTAEQYRQAREAIWRGAQRRGSLDNFKSVYSIFVSRVDAYTVKEVSELSPAAQGQVGIVNAKQIWRENVEFWRTQDLRLDQEIVFASTGTKDPRDVPWKYAAALAGSDIQTNPPATNEAIAESDQTFVRALTVDPPREVVEEIQAKVDSGRMHEILMREGIEKFVAPQKSLLLLIGERRAAHPPQSQLAAGTARQP